MSMWRMDIRIQPYVIRFGFYGIYRLGHIAIDWPLITSLVERWRPETHTFHVPVGEMTITLQDVAILLGLRIHGPAVTGTCLALHDADVDVGDGDLPEAVHDGLPAHPQLSQR